MLNEEKKLIIPNLIKDGKTQPVVDYSDCLFEKVYVETPVDTDGDGKNDLIAVYIRRPKETLCGCQVPAVYVANPYIMTCNEDWYVPYHVDKDLEVIPQQYIDREDISYDFSVSKETVTNHVRQTMGFAQVCETEEFPMECISPWYSYFNSRGYASVFCGGLGTRGSDGVTVSGSREEILAFKSVIDWLNGRCRAFTDKRSNIEIKADWCTGNVAMSGKSYLGTLCIGVATTGVEGLKTIIPEAAISNWYAYDRYNGLNVPPMGWQGDDIALLSKYCCSRALDTDDYDLIKEPYEKVIKDIEEAQDRRSGNYNKFWDERNYLNLVNHIKASVFIVHGLNDWNVKMNQCIPLWEELAKRDIPRRLMLHQGEHVYIHDLEGSNFNDILHKWLDYWLYGIENGTEKVVSQVMVQSNLDQNVWLESREWSPEGFKRMKFSIEKSQKSVFTDDLSLTKYDRQKDNFVDWRDGIVLSSEAMQYSLKYMWTPEKETRICGKIRISFEAAIDRPTGILSAMLVDVGSQCRTLDTRETAVENGIVWGKNTPISHLVRFKVENTPSPYKIITRGWLNPQNRNNDWCKEAVEPGHFYKYSFHMVPMDYTVKEGHQMALIIYGTDPEATERPFTVTTVTLDESTIDVRIPCLQK